MDNFGVRFSVTSRQRFELLRDIYAEVKRDKDGGEFRSAQEWAKLVPSELYPAFDWPSDSEREYWQSVRNSTVVVVESPGENLGGRWVFDRVFESLEEGEYDILTCEMMDPGTGELWINPHAYPYGGVGPLIALAEAFEFEVLGVNEYGKYQTREHLLRERGRGR